MGRRIAVILWMICAAQHLSAQTEFMIHGRVRQPQGTADSILLTVRSKTDSEFKKDIYLTGKGDYRVFMKYGNLFTYRFSKKGYLPLVFEVSTIIPPNRPQCCQLPLELSFKMIEPGTGFDSLFAGTFMKIEYQPELRGYNNNIDIDYLVPTMLRKAQKDKVIAEKKERRRKAIADSMAIENKYYEFLNKGNVFYAQKNYSASREMFNNALGVRPGREYPLYKLEDIRTAEERFSKNPDTLKTYVSKPKPAIKTVEIPQIPKFVYTPPSQATIEQRMQADIAKKIEANSSSAHEAKARIALVASTAPAKTQPPAIAPVPAKVVAVAAAAPPVIKPVVPEPTPTDDIEVNIPIVSVPVASHQDTGKPKQEKVTVFFDETAYQDSLLKQYPDFKTESIEQDLYKKVTRVYINKDRRVTIYMKVEHAWGGIYYFIDRTPLVPENISQGFYDSETMSVDFLPSNE